MLAVGRDDPAELDCSGRTDHRRLRAWEEVEIRGRLHYDLPRLLKRGDAAQPIQ